MSKYTKPRLIRISRDYNTKKLYELEEKLHGYLNACTEEWAILNDISLNDFYTHSLPQTLFDLLESMDLESSKIACEGFLEYLEERK